MRGLKKDLDMAVKRLQKNRVLVDTKGKLVKLGRDGPGIKMWGEIDFLCNFCGFHWARPDGG